MKKLFLTVLALTGLGFTAIASAHHAAVEYDLSGREVITGKVVTFRISNPHSLIIIEVDDEKGKREIEFEGHSRSNYYRGGWRPDMVNEGDEVTLTFGPMRDGSEGGFVHSVLTASGDSF